MDALPFALLLLMLINALIEFHVFVVAVIMFYILELIMEIMPNYPTATTSSDQTWSRLQFLQLIDPYLLTYG
jgi:hypothetical protein